MTERWRAEAEEVARDVHDAMQFQDDQGATDTILRLIERVQPQWQPIDTAPKDGRNIVVWSSGTGRWPRIARWCISGDACWWGLDHAELGRPTHWMALPDPPGSGETEPDKMQGRK